jgi:hypothetical protein
VWKSESEEVIDITPTILPIEMCVFLPINKFHTVPFSPSKCFAKTKSVKKESDIINIVNILYWNITKNWIVGKEYKVSKKDVNLELNKLSGKWNKYKNEIEVRLWIKLQSSSIFSR